MTVSAFQANAFQTNPLAFQIVLGPFHIDPKYAAQGEVRGMSANAEDESFADSANVRSFSGKASVLG